MIVISLTQVRQSNGYGSGRNDDMFNLRLGSGVGPPTVRHQLHPLTPFAQTIIQEETTKRVRTQP